MSPRVTVVVPCFNHGRFVAECIASLERQTLDDWQAIVVDDASTDGTTPAQCDAVASERVRVVHLAENHGRAPARNVGIGMAESEAILSLDADDTLDPDHLAATVPLLLGDPGCGIVYTDYQFFGDRDIVMHGRRFDKKRLYVLQYIYAGSLFRKSAFAKTAGYRREFNIGNEDYDLWLSIVEAGYHGVYVPRPLYRQRKHAAQWSAQNERALADQILETRLLLCRFHAQGFAESGQLQRFLFDTWLADAKARNLAGDEASAKASLRKAIATRPWSVTAWKLWARTALGRAERKPEPRGL